MTVKKKFKIVDMHCSSCSITIDGDLEDTKGVVWASSSFVGVFLSLFKEHPPAKSTPARSNVNS